MTEPRKIVEYLDIEGFKDRLFDQNKNYIDSRTGQEYDILDIRMDRGVMSVIRRNIGKNGLETIPLANVLNDKEA